MVKTVSSFVLAVACFFMACTAMASPLQLSVNAGLSAGTVDVSLRNEGASPVSILLWDTPFERTLSHNVFVVERAIKGFPLPHISKYIGRSVKRSDPAEDAYVTLIPGQR